MYTCKTGILPHQLPVFMMILLNFVCIPVRLGSLENTLYVYVCLFVESMYTCKTEYFSKWSYSCDVVQGIYKC